jgi:hypothetical protein
LRPLVARAPGRPGKALNVKNHGQRHRGPCPTIPVRKSADLACMNRSYAARAGLKNVRTPSEQVSSVASGAGPSAPRLPSGQAAPAFSAALCNPTAVAPRPPRVTASDRWRCRSANPR